MKHLICWVAGHRWYEVSYAIAARSPFRRTRECTRCGDTVVWAEDRTVGK